MLRNIEDKRVEVGEPTERHERLELESEVTLARAFTITKRNFICSWRIVIYAAFSRSYLHIVSMTGAIVSV